MKQQTIDRSESQVLVPVPPPEAAPLATTQTEPSIGAILQQAVAQNMPPETLEKLVALYERMSDRRAAGEFASAMAAFKAECPPIPRRTENNQFKVTRDGVQVARRYAALEDIEATIREPLGKHGLSYRWGESAVVNGQLSMTCIVSHVGGHSECSPVLLPVDSKAGCSEQQKYGAAMTYAQRYSLIQVLGLTTCDEDDDGNAPPPQTITEQQAAKIDALIREVGEDRRASFLKWLAVETVAAIPAAMYVEAVKALESKRAKKPKPTDGDNSGEAFGREISAAMDAAKR